MLLKSAVFTDFESEMVAYERVWYASMLAYTSARKCTVSSARRYPEQESHVQNPVTSVMNPLLSSSVALTSQLNGSVAYHATRTMTSSSTKSAMKPATSTTRTGARSSFLDFSSIDLTRYTLATSVPVVIMWPRLTSHGQAAHVTSSSVSVKPRLSRDMRMMLLVSISEPRASRSRNGGCASRTAFALRYTRMPIMHATPTTAFTAKRKYPAPKRASEMYTHSTHQQICFTSSTSSTPLETV
mmetsp:Transcript_18478/g.62640  ORF Transcript_18478/g.62640 Transcript_18478/m.62640 type:complete len:242 (-) Transcript_18478:26-751(-)